MQSSDNRPLEVRRAFVVRTYDIDFAQHVSNIVYLRWLEDLRYDLLAATVPFETLAAEGIVPILTRTNIQYRRAIRLGEAVTGAMWVTSVGGARVTLAAQITVGSDLCAEAVQDGVFAERASGRPVRIPIALREAWERR